MAEAARAGVDLDDELSFADVEAVLEHTLHDVDLDEVIARAEGAQLVAAALLRVVRDGGGIRFVEASAGLDGAQVRFLAVADLHGARRAAGEHAVEVVTAQREWPAAPDAGGNLARQRVRQLAQQRLHLVERRAGAEHAHAAVDVIADAARRDHAALRVDRRHAADGEAVALVHVGHGDDVALQAGKRGHVDELLERAVAEDGFEHALGRVNARRHAHVAAIGCGDLPEPVG